MIKTAICFSVMKTEALPENISSTHVVSGRAALRKATPLSSYYSRLRAKIEDKTARVGIIGLGYVGLPLSAVFNDAGYRTIGFEKSAEKVEFLNDGVSYIQDVPSASVSKHLKENRFEATLDFGRIQECDVVLICVPTPLAKSKEPDMSFIIQAIDSISEKFVAGQLIVLESTTYPGTTREVLLPRLEQNQKANLTCGEDFFLAFSPERVDPGNPKFNTYNTPKVVGGITEACGDLGSLLYSKCMEKVVRVSSPESAEMVKLLENTFRAVNIGLVNEVAMMCEKLNIDCWEVIEAASTKPFGYMPFYPGPGLGGHCIPIDPSYLSWKLRTLNYNARFIELATTINRSMPAFCYDKVVSALNDSEKSVKGSKILISGVAYKKNIDDMRESPALDLIELLEKNGAKVEYFDPFVPELKMGSINLKSVQWSDTIGSQYDLVIITTDHSNVDYKSLLMSSKKVLDTRNAMKDFHDSKIVKL